MPVERKAFTPSDSLVVFSNDEFFQLDFKQDAWAYGEVEAFFDNPLTIAENASVIRIDDFGTRSSLLVSGGVLEAGSILNWAFGMSFERSEQKGDKVIAYMSQSDPLLVLPQQRMMHQSCIVRNAQDEPMLVIVGGKIGDNPVAAKFTNSVIGFNMKEFFLG